MKHFHISQSVFCYRQRRQMLRLILTFVLLVSVINYKSLFFLMDFKASTAMPSSPWKTEQIEDFYPKKASVGPLVTTKLAHAHR